MVIPYLNFNGNCAEAIRFYSKVFDSKPYMIKAYNGYLSTNPHPTRLGEWIMHAQMDICGDVFWFADDTSEISRGNMLRLALSVDTISQAQKIFERLSAEGTVHLPPTDAFYSPLQAVLTDKFGVNWTILVASERLDENEPAV